MEKKKQHYIPQFYLNYFTDPLIPIMYAPYVWVYDRTDKSIKKKSPKNIAYENGYNNIMDKDGNVSSIVEDQFQEIEDNTSKIYRKIIKLKYISRSERLTLAKFVFSMLERVPRFRAMCKFAIESGYADKFMNEDDNLENKSSKLMMDSVIRATHGVSHLLLRMDWSLLIAPNGANFITSDNPVVVRNPKEVNLLMCGISSSPEVIVTFPLTSKICLFGSWGRYRSVVEKISVGEVEHINLETFIYSNRYLFSSSQYFQKEILDLNNLINGS
ncbi:MAG: DUF4238 domain-containing protein [Clostridium sp.]|uniref:DUF4238 domain-containing protein n=1 Tax=Clostridium sp. TaxID=1506 RepID=UPI0039E9CC03